MWREGPCWLSWGEGEGHKVPSWVELQFLLLYKQERVTENAEVQAAESTPHANGLVSTWETPFVSLGRFHHRPGRFHFSLGGGGGHWGSAQNESSLLWGRPSLLMPLGPICHHTDSLQHGSKGTKGMRTQRPISYSAATGGRFGLRTGLVPAQCCSV